LAPAHAGGPTNPDIDSQTNLKRTWITSGQYESPVEWDVCGDELTIVSFNENGTVVRIKDKAIAGAFLELWQMLDQNIRANPEYGLLPQKARRKI
jgi:hypothetical protein